MLGNIAKDNRLDEGDKIDAERTSSAAARTLVNQLFVSVPTAVMVIFDGQQTYAEFDAYLRAILRNSMSKAMLSDFHAEGMDVLAKTSTQIFSWIIGKCNMFASIQANNLLADLTTHRWDSKSESARKFLITWQSKVRNLDELDGCSWTALHKFENLRIVFGHHPTFGATFADFDRTRRNGKHVVDNATFTAFFSELMQMAVNADVVADRDKSSNMNPKNPETVRALATTTSNGHRPGHRRMVACFACGEWGHVVNDCPDKQKKEEYQLGGKKMAPKPFRSALHSFTFVDSDDSEEDAAYSDC